MDAVWPRPLAGHPAAVKRDMLPLFVSVNPLWSGSIGCFLAVYISILSRLECVLSLSLTLLPTAFLPWVIFLPNSFIRFVFDDDRPTEMLPWTRKNRSSIWSRGSSRNAWMTKGALWPSSTIKRTSRLVRCRLAFTVSRKSPRDWKKLDLVAVAHRSLVFLSDGNGFSFWYFRRESVTIERRSAWPHRWHAKSSHGWTESVTAPSSWLE